MALLKGAVAVINPEMLTNKELDRAVACVEGIEFTDQDHPYAHELDGYQPSIDPYIATNIIEREHISVTYDKDWVYDPSKVDPDDEPDNGDRWLAWKDDESISCYGPTMIIAAMRLWVRYNQRSNHESDY